VEGKSEYPAFEQAFARTVRKGIVCGCLPHSLEIFNSKDKESILFSVYLKKIFTAYEIY